MKPQATRHKAPSLWIALIGLCAYALVTALFLWALAAILMAMA